jgi:hypothetical protein
LENDFPNGRDLNRNAAQISNATASIAIGLGSLWGASFAEANFFSGWTGLVTAKKILNGR